MALNLNAHNLSSSGLRGSSMDGEEVDPMSSLANLADVMLVFACGLMMALVVYWNIDVTGVTQLDNTTMEPIDNPDTMPEDMVSGGSAYVERGTVYQDPNTGKYYMLSEEGQAPNASSTDKTDSSATASPTQSSSSHSSSTGNASSGATVAAPDRTKGGD